MNSPQKVIAAFAVTFLFGMLLLILFGENGLADLNILRSARNRLMDKNEVIAQENLSLYHQIERLRDDLNYIENIARQELGMIGAAEVIIKFRNPSDLPHWGRLQHPPHSYEKKSAHDKRRI